MDFLNLRPEYWTLSATSTRTELFLCVNAVIIIFLTISLSSYSSEKSNNTGRTEADEGQLKLVSSSDVK